MLSTSSMADDALIVFCTAPDAEVAARLARGVLERKLAACVNVIPGLRSLYWWQGELQDDSEVQLLIKTQRGRFSEIESFIKDNHPYELPELIAVSVVAGSEPYLRWLREQATGHPRGS
jgi:periplasmic divalent cation tolerance protein